MERIKSIAAVVAFGAVILIAGWATIETSEYTSECKPTSNYAKWADCIEAENAAAEAASSNKMIYIQVGKPGHVGSNIETNRTPIGAFIIDERERISMELNKLNGLKGAEYEAVLDAIVDEMELRAGRVALHHGNLMEVDNVTLSHLIIKTILEGEWLKQ